jgi:hypothetical protein
LLRIEDTIFSFDILEKKFRCNLKVCHGNCCRYGDSGAPLTNDEAKILDEIWPDIQAYLTEEGIESIEMQGRSIVDFENEKVTPLIHNEECAYSIKNDDIFLCGIEKAWSEGKITFRKPLSCHLFPIRIKQYTDFRAVNYEELAICSSARKSGEREDLYVYKFLKEPLIRAIGKSMYHDLCLAADELRKNKTLKK